ncbi:MAG: hypothetical protein DDT31_01360 [Syntrophomonadaceae bacterium]|nr:hypothetical protein [Bacillota bacterium]
MAKKLFVGGLSYDTVEESLRKLFVEAGTVESAVVIVDKMSNRSKGFGFVEMATEEEAKKAIELLNGKDLDGRSITVNEARPLEDRPRRSSSDRRSSGGGFGDSRRRRF